MSNGKATFLSGTVLGMTAGLLCGHVIWWSRLPSRESPPQVAQVMGEYESTAPWFPSPSPEWLPQIQSVAPKHEVYYAPASDSVILDGSGRGDPVLPLDLSPSAAPRTPSLLPPPQASPIGREPSTDLSQVITREVPELSEQEQEIWRDVLTGLGDEEAAGILRFWKQHGQLVDLPAGGLSGEIVFDEFPLDPAFPRYTDRPDSATESGVPPCESIQSRTAVIDRLRRITRHNLANAQTPGYRALLPIIASSAFTGWEESHTDGPVIELERITLSLREGNLVETGEQFDLALCDAPRRCFQLARDGRSAVTRYGHFRLDAERRLCLDAQGVCWLLVPEVQLPEEATRVVIASDGQVSAAGAAESEFRPCGRIEPCEILSPRELRPIGHQLFEVVDAACLLPGSSSMQNVRVVQGHLETSNVNVEEERGRLKWLDELARLLAE